MQTFNRLMALTGFTAVAVAGVGFALADQVGGDAIGWVIELSSALVPQPPLSF